MVMPIILSSDHIDKIVEMCKAYEPKQHIQIRQIGGELTSIWYMGRTITIIPWFEYVMTRLLILVTQHPRNEHKMADVVAYMYTEIEHPVDVLYAIYCASMKLQTF